MYDGVIIYFVFLKACNSKLQESSKQLECVKRGLALLSVILFKNLSLIQCTMIMP